VIVVHYMSYEFYITDMCFGLGDTIKSLSGTVIFVESSPGPSLPERAGQVSKLERAMINKELVFILPLRIAGEVVSQFEEK
jgi:hypothetical protein